MVLKHQLGLRQLFFDGRRFLVLMHRQGTQEVDSVPEVQYNVGRRR
jgi:hypothetical protein